MSTLGAGSRATGATPIKDVLPQLREGRIVVVVDHQRELGGVTVAADRVTPASITFMTRQAGSWLCLALTGQRCEELGVRSLRPGSSGRELGLLQPVDAAAGVRSGMSAEDRVHTIQVAVSRDSSPKDLVAHGHVQLFRTHRTGVVGRPGLAEAGVELARLAGCAPAAVVCDLQTAHGAAASLEAIARFSSAHALPMVEMKDLIAYTQLHGRVVEPLVSVDLPTPAIRFLATAYIAEGDDANHLALVNGELDTGIVGVHIHVRCPGDIFHSHTCNCRLELEAALEEIARRGRGVVVYLSSEGGELDLRSDHGLPVDGSCDGLAAAILSNLGVNSIELFNKDERLRARLADYGLSVAPT